MTTINSRVTALKNKTQTLSYSFESWVEKNDFTEAVFLLNDYLKSDTTLQSLLGSDFNIFPLVAEEPFDGPSTPYIRYISLPSPGPIWRIRTDIIRYMVGDKNYKAGGRIMERMIKLMDKDGSETIFPIKNSRFKIQGISFVGASPPTTPDQEDGVMERGINIALIYTVIS